jgi:hypothetical protein
MEGFHARIDKLDADGVTARVLVKLFGRNTPVDVPLADLVLDDEPPRVAPPDAPRDPTAILDGD